MKRLLTLLAVALIVAINAEAKTPVEEDIMAKTMNASSEYYYPNLMMRYRNLDTTLSDEDYHYLYYGFAYHENYRPLDPNHSLDHFFTYLEALDMDKPDVDLLNQLIAIGKEVMERDPFSPKVLNVMAFAYGALGDSHNERIYFNYLQNIIATIESSGDGLTKDTPQHILMYSHAVDVLASHGLESRQSKLISRNIEFLPLATPKGKLKGYYFDYGRIYRNRPENTEYRRERTWQFNNLKPRHYK